MLITAAYPFSNIQVYSISHSFRNQCATSHTFARSHCPGHNSWASSSSSSSPVTRQHSILESSVRSSITDTNIIMDGLWQSFKMDYDSDALEMDYDSDSLETDYDNDPQEMDYDND